MAGKYRGGTSVKGAPHTTGVTVGSGAATQIIGPQPERVAVTIWNYWDEDADPNKDKTTTVFIGGSDVAASGATRGIPIKPGEHFPDDDTNSSWYGITDDGAAYLIVCDIY